MLLLLSVVLAVCVAVLIFRQNALTKRVEKLEQSSFRRVLREQGGPAEIRVPSPH